MAFADSQTGAIIFHGESPSTVKLVGAAVKGDAIGFSSGWKRALATTASVVQMRCVAAEDGVDDQEITVYFGDTEVGGDRFSGAAVGGAIYVAETADNGKYTQTAPTDTGDSIKIVGNAISAIKLLLSPQLTPDLLK